MSSVSFSGIAPISLPQLYTQLISSDLECVIWSLKLFGTVGRSGLERRRRESSIDVEPDLFSLSLMSMSAGSMRDTSRVISGRASARPPSGGLLSVEAVPAHTAHGDCRSLLYVANPS